VRLGIGPMEEDGVSDTGTTSSSSTCTTAADGKVPMGSGASVRWWGSGVNATDWVVIAFVGDANDGSGNRRWLHGYWYFAWALLGSTNFEFDVTPCFG